MNADLSVAEGPERLTVVMIAVGVEDSLAKGTPVYHRGRSQWGVAEGPSLSARGTHWVAFDDDREPEPIQVSNELLEAAVLRLSPTPGRDGRTVAANARAEVLEVRWGFQIRKDGVWSDYPHGTWPDRQRDDVRHNAVLLYGEDAELRPFKVVKSVETDWPQ